MAEVVECPNCHSRAGWRVEEAHDRFECVACGFWVQDEPPAAQDFHPKTLRPVDG